MTLTTQRDIERELFEAWAAPKQFDLRRPGYAYANNCTDYAWHGWQARAAQATAEPVGPLVGCSDGETREVVGMPTIRNFRIVAAPDRAPSTEPVNAFSEFMIWAADHLGQGYSRATEEGTFTDPVTRWAFAAFKAGKKRAPSTDSAADKRDAGALAIAATINRKLGDVIAGRLYLMPDDLAALQRFHECAMDFDSGGHDVSKEAMARLREIGAVENKGFGRHQVTSFGSYVLGRIAGEDVRIPLKTYAEHNEESRIAAQPPQEKKA